MTVGRSSRNVCLQYMYICEHGVRSRERLSVSPFANMFHETVYLHMLVFMHHTVLDVYACREVFSCTACTIHCELLMRAVHFEVLALLDFASHASDMGGWRLIHKVLEQLCTCSPVESVTLRELAVPTASSRLMASARDSTTDLARVGTNLRDAIIFREVSGRPRSSWVLCFGKPHPFEAIS